tara:strand:- start:82 stop:879 length:798 start_codon:yes stop_codon:yes gene_type:complete
MSKKIKIFKDSLHKYSLNDKKKYIEILNELDTYMSKITNETIGMSAEKYICDAFNLPCDIESYRIDDNCIEKMHKSNIINVLEERNILPTKHIGKKNGPIDFEANDKTLSIKTLKRKQGKICPQGGQPTYKSFDKKWNLIEQTNNLDRLHSNQIRWQWIKKNIGLFLNHQRNNTFCCDYLLLISDCEKNPKAELLENKNYNFSKIDIEFTREKYEEKIREGKRPAEFSTTAKGIINGKNVSIGEFQFHKNSRTEVKFRFFNSLFH